MKDLSTRLEESISIRENLKSLGIFVIEENKEKFKTASNNFIRNNEGSVIKLYFDSSSTSYIEVIFSNTKQSGCLHVRE